MKQEILAEALLTNPPNLPRPADKVGGVLVKLAQDYDGSQAAEQAATSHSQQDWQEFADSVRDLPDKL